MTAVRSGSARRAPRLGPGERIAPYLSRGRGRFARIDPSKPRRPAVVRILGVLGWALLLAESLRRARRAVRADPDSAPGGVAGDGGESGDGRW